jgi:predicted Ser/Thr protein kinase
MPSCKACGTRVTPDQTFCSQCGARLIKPVEGAATITLARHVPASSSTSIDEERFPPGVILAQRYRIISLLGRGGMGEVYRANDLLLGQPVALKFLLPAATASESALSRFRREVRTARQVSHPNVCRVYDIGEVDGLTYLTMEYIDGEDLASLLRRIGKLSQEKALEIARKLCAGLAAAHDQGVVHRDLKPGNIMLDGKGQVRITDFGLASLAENVRDVRSGTPAYMAPEQRAGKEVTAKSDIYALGILLHELFTGKRPSRESKNTELDPAVERVILRCLEEDPRMRPASALSVAAALPGGDPLGAALAAGETPSPEVVANAGAIEGLRVPVAVACLAAIILGISAFCFLQQRSAIVNQIPMENSPEVLAAKARDIAKSLGYTKRPVDTAFGWEYDMDYLRYIAAQKDDSTRQARIRANRPPPLYFWYRESPRYLYHPTGYMVTRTQPHGFDPGMLEVLLDSEGRLIEFDAQPPAETSNQTSNQGDTRAPDWGRLFAAAALDAARFTPAQPVLTPRSFSDTRAAWVGSWDDSPHDTLRVEAAAYQGRPVFFRSFGPWSRADQTPSPLWADFTFPSLLLFAVVLPIGAGLLAWRNTRIGRGDRRGSFRLALFAFISVFLRDVAWQHHLPTIAEVGLLFFALRDALMFGALFWVLYMAFEPYVRRRSPATLISWSRLLAGRFRDPLVGADLLTGFVLGAVGLCVVRPLVSPFVASLAPQLMPTAGAWLSLWSWNTAVGAVGSALSCVFLLTLMLLLVRFQWLASLLFISLVSLVIALPGATLSAVVLCGIILYSLTRFGLLSTAALLYVYDIGAAFPPPTNLSAWYSDATLIATASILALAVYAFRTTLAGRPLWRDKLHEA